MFIVSPAREGGMERVLIIITDLNGEEIMRTRIYSSLYIRQVKLAISRSKYVGILLLLMCSNGIDHYSQSAGMLYPLV